MTLKPETLAYLRDWLAWVERGAPEGVPYSRQSGLCPATKNCRISKSPDDIRDDLEMAFYGKRYPFGEYDYYLRVAKCSQHECPKRLAWVREQLAQHHDR